MNGECVRLASGGEGALLEKHQGLVHCACNAYRTQLAGTILQHSDLVQEAEICLLKAVRYYDPSKGTAFSTLATCIIHRRLQQLLRSPGVRSNAYIDPDEQSQSDSHDHGTSEECQMLKAKLHCLSERQRDVIELTYGLRDKPPLSTPDVAGIMGISEACVTSHRSAAYKELRRLLPKLKRA